MSIDRKIHLSETPLLFPLLFLIAGIAVGASDVFSWRWIAPLPIIVGCIYLINRNITVFAIYFLFAVVGALLGRSAIHDQLSEAEKRCVRGKVTMANEYGESYRIVVNEFTTNNNYAAWIADMDYEVLPGDVVDIEGIAVAPKYDATIPDEITNRRFLLENKIYAEMAIVDSFRLIKEADGIMSYPMKIQRYLVNRLRHSGLNQQAETFMQAILLGKENLEPEIRSDFSRSGLSHVLALSGTHVAVIAMLISIFFFPLTLFGSRRIGEIMTLLILWAYAIITGLSPSVLRAVIMISFLIVGRMMHRNANAINYLCAAALLILLFSPLTIFNIGFQLSFLAVAGILLFMPMIMSSIVSMKNKNIRYWLIKICPYILLPICAVVATAPLSVYYFHLFPAWFLITNLIIALLLPLLLSGGLILLILSILNIKALWLSSSLNYIVDAAINVSHSASMAQPSGLSAVYPPLIVVVITYLALTFVWLAWNNRRRVFLYSALICVGAGCAVAVLAMPHYPDCELIEWSSDNAFNILYRRGPDTYLITDAPPKYHPGMQRAAEFRLTDYLGKRRAKLHGVFSDSLRTSGLQVYTDSWIVDGRAYLIVSDENVLTDSVLRASAIDLNPATVVISHGYKGDGAEIRKTFPEARIVVSPSLYAPRRKKILDQLRSL